MRTRGFSLLEVMIAMAVMLVGAVGAITGIISADQTLRAGQMRVHGQVLVDASLQRARLQNKEQLYTSALTVTAGTMPTAQALGTGNWTMDPTTAVAGDVSTGALFIVRADGTMAPCTTTSTPACTSITTCASAAIPDGVFCREVVSTRTAPAWTPGAIVPTGAFVTTRWVRVIQKRRSAAETAAQAVLGREVFAQ